MQDENIKIFIVYLIFLSLESIHLICKAQIILLLIKKVIILAKFQIL